MKKKGVDDELGITLKDFSTEDVDLYDQRETNIVQMSSIYTSKEHKTSVEEENNELELTSFFPSLPTSTTFSSLICCPLEKKAITASGGIRRALPQARFRSRSLREKGKEEKGRQLTRRSSHDGRK